MATPEAAVFVVDDDTSVREALRGLLRSAGFVVETFGSAQEFLARPPSDLPACLVLDVGLPDLSGLDLQQRMAQLNREMPIVFITGHGDVGTSPWPVMNTMGISLFSWAMRCCRSSPLRSGNPTSRTRQAGRSDGGRARNSCAEPNVSTTNPADRSKPRKASRTDVSSSTTKTAASGVAMKRS